MEYSNSTEGSYPTKEATQRCTSCSVAVRTLVLVCSSLSSPVNALLDSWLGLHSYVKKVLKNCSESLSLVTNDGMMCDFDPGEMPGKGTRTSV